MANQMVHFRLPQTIVSRIKEIVKDKGYSSMQELFREKMRSVVEEDDKLQRDITKLKALQGSAQNIRRFTQEERREIFLEFLEKSKKGYDPFKELGIDFKGRVIK